MCSGRACWRASTMASDLAWIRFGYLMFFCNAGIIMCTIDFIHHNCMFHPLEGCVGVCVCVCDPSV